MLFNNFSTDKGAHTWAKVVQALALGFVVLTYAGSFQVLASQVQHFAGFKAYHSVAVGFIPPQLNFISVVVASILDLVLFLVAFKVAQRNLVAVRIFRIALLASLPTAVIGCYRGLLSSPLPLSDRSGLLIAVGVMVAIKLGLYFLYASRMMKAFLTAPAHSARPEASTNAHV